jgi:hypothetical protein
MSGSTKRQCDRSALFDPAIGMQNLLAAMDAK